MDRDGAVNSASHSHDFKIGDICRLQGKLVIVHKLTDLDWATVVGLDNPTVHATSPSTSYQVRTSQLKPVKK